MMKETCSRKCAGVEVGGYTMLIDRCRSRKWAGGVLGG